MPEGGQDLPQHIKHALLIIDDEDSFRWLRVDRHFLFSARRGSADAESAINESPPEGRAALALTDDDALVRAGNQSRHSFYPQLVTSRMEVDLSSACSCEIE